MPLLSLRVLPSNTTTQLQVADSTSVGQLKVQYTDHVLLPLATKRAVEAEASDASCCARLERWLTSPASKRLLNRVCRELELGEHDAFDLIIEYAKFLELKLALSDHGDTEDEDDARWNRLEPPLLIAAVWRLHVLDTLNYSRFCAAVFAGPMHYDPEGDKLISLDYRSIAAAATVRAHLSRFGGPPANTDGAWRFDPDLDEGELDPWRMAEADAHRLHWRVAALAPKAGKDARAFGHVPPAFAAVVVDGVTLHDDEVLEDPNAVVYLVLDEDQCSGVGNFRR